MSEKVTAAKNTKYQINNIFKKKYSEKEKAEIINKKLESIINKEIKRQVQN